MPFLDACRARRLGVLLLAATVGCGGAGSIDQTPVEVTGRVFLGDEPLEFGSVVFQPARGGQPARGKIAADGSFTLTTYSTGDGAVPGKHSVRVTCYEKQDPSLETTAAGDSLGASLIPEKYTNAATSGIEILVLSGGNAPAIIKLQPEPPAEESADEPAPIDEAPPADPAAAAVPEDAGIEPANADDSVVDATSAANPEAPTEGVE